VPGYADIGPPIASVAEPAREGVWAEECVEPVLKGVAWCSAAPGLGGTDAEGDGASTIHIRWERVAQSFATVCARVLKGVT